MDVRARVADLPTCISACVSAGADQSIMIAEYISNTQLINSMPLGLNPLPAVFDDDRVDAGSTSGIFFSFNKSLKLKFGSTTNI